MSLNNAWVMFEEYKYNFFMIFGGQNRVDQENGTVATVATVASSRGRR